MKILDSQITKGDIFDIAEVEFDDGMVKAVVDIGRELVAIDAPMHADIEEMLLEDGSAQEDLWGINFHPNGEFIEYDSLINIRPRQNKHLYIDDEATRNRIVEVVNKWISQT